MSTRVWVTRDEPDDGPLTTALRAAGLVPVLEPVLERRVVRDLTGDLESLGPDDWLVLTSVFAIEAAPLDAARVPRVAVVGTPSREAAEARGLRVELVSDTGTAAGLFEALATRAVGQVVLYPMSSAAKPPALPAGVELRCPVLYETVARPYRADVVDEVDVIAVASPSAVRAVGRRRLPFASIGPTTTTALRELGVEPWVEASRPSFEALTRAIADQRPP